jgi:type I restriction enzyme, S subunit
MIRKETLSSSWPQRPLGEVADFLDSRRRPVKEKDRKPGEYPYFGANGPQGTIDDYLFDEPLILLAEDGGHFGELGKTIAYRVDGKCWVNNHAHVLRPKVGVDIDYLNRHLERFDVTPFITGTTRGKLTKGAAERIPISLPPLDEQRRIAAILDKADAIRRKRQEAIQLTEELLRSTFLEMFGDPVVNRKGWPKEPFGNVGELDRGRSRHRPRNAPELLGGSYPLIQTGDISNSGGYIRAFSQTYSEKGLAQSKMWPVGTLCITIAANIARTAILTIEACFPDSVVGFTPNKKVRTEYIQWWMSFLQKILEETAPESAQKNINLEILRNLEVPLPPMDLQNLFVSCVKRTEKIKDTLRGAISQDNHLFSSLVQRAFRGEL